MAETETELAARIAEVDRIVEAEMNRRKREASYMAASFPRETWARELAARETEGDCDNPIRVHAANGIREGKLDDSAVVRKHLSALSQPPADALDADILNAEQQALDRVEQLKVRHAAPQAEAERAGQAAYTGGYEEYRNKWIGDHEEMCADLVRLFVPRAPTPASAVERENERTVRTSPWLSPDAAPAAMHVLAARFDKDAGEWFYAVVMSPPSAPFTHWRPLPEPPASTVDAGREG